MVALSDSSVISESFDLNAVARLDQHLDDIDLLEVADVGDLDFREAGMRFVLLARCYTVTGFGFSGSMPYFLIASATWPRSNRPASASAFSEAQRSHPVAVDLEEVAQFVARVGTAEAVGAEHRDTCGRPGMNGRIWSAKGVHVIGRRQHRARCPRGIASTYTRGASAGCSRFQRSPSGPSRASNGEARAAPDIGFDAPIAFQQFGRGDDTRAGSCRNRATARALARALLCLAP